MNQKNVALIVVAVCNLFTLDNSASAQGTAFTYQGQLSASGSPANGNYDFTFALFNNSSTNTGQVGSTLTNLDVGVTNGLFIVTLDFGARFHRLELLAVHRCAHQRRRRLHRAQSVAGTDAHALCRFAGSASNLSGTLPSGNLSGTYGAALTLNNSSNSFTGNGTGLTNVNAATVGGMSAGQFWNLAGNTGTTNGVNFLEPRTVNRCNCGPTTAAPCFWTGRATPLNPTSLAEAVKTPSATPWVPPSAGGYQNIIQFANYSTIPGGFRNIIQSSSTYSSIGGGFGNTVASESTYSIIAGGEQNSISSGNPFVAGGYSNTVNAYCCTIAGGISNNIQFSASYSTIAGGQQNSIQNTAPNSTIAGGYLNTIQSSSLASTIGGGQQNTNNASYCTIPGGLGNVIQSGSSESFIGGGLNNSIASSTP